MKHLQLFLLAVAVISLTAISSCTKDEDNGPIHPKLIEGDVDINRGYYVYGKSFDFTVEAKEGFENKGYDVTIYATETPDEKVATNRQNTTRCRHGQTIHVDESFYYVSFSQYFSKSYTVNGEPAITITVTNIE